MDSQQQNMPGMPMLQPPDAPGGAAAFPAPPQYGAYSAPQLAPPTQLPADRGDFTPPSVAGTGVAAPGHGAMAMPSAPSTQAHPTGVPLYTAPAQQSAPAVSNTSDEVDTTQMDEPWIAKAKEIIMQTRDDPYRQSRALSKLRADFLRARYSKEIKVTEDSAS